MLSNIFQSDLEKDILLEILDIFDHMGKNQFFSKRSKKVITSNIDKGLSISWFQKYRARILHLSN